jgi:hypothetical protein
MRQVADETGSGLGRDLMRQGLDKASIECGKEWMRLGVDEIIVYEAGRG